MREWVKEYGPVLRIAGPGSDHNILIVEHEHLDKVLGKDANDYPKVPISVFPRAKHVTH